MREINRITQESVLNHSLALKQCKNEATSIVRQNSAALPVELSAAYAVCMPQAIRAEPAILINDKTRIQRDVLLQALRGMERTLMQQSDPLHPNIKRSFLFLRGSTSLTLQTKPQSELVSLIKELHSKSEQVLDIKECAMLSLQMERLARLLPAKGFLPELSKRLGVLGSAAWAEQAREAAEQQLLHQFKAFDQPGTSRERRGGVSVGVGFGLDGGAKAKVGLDFLCAKGMDNDDEGFVFQNKSFSLTASAGAKLGLSGVATVGASLKGKTQVLHFHEYSSAKAFVHINAHQLQHASRRETLKQGSRTIIGALLKLMRKGHGNELQAYRQLQQQVKNQQQRLSVLLGMVGTPTCSDGLSGLSQQQAGSGNAYSVKGSAQVRADMDTARVGAGAQINIEKIIIEVESQTQFWDKLKDGDDKVAVDETIAHQRLNALNEKCLSMLGEDRNRKPLSRLLALADASTENINDIDEVNNLPVKTLHQTLHVLETEFDHYCAVIQQRDISKPHLKVNVIEDSIARSWQGKGREEVFANMALCHAVLGSALLKKQQPMDEVNRLVARLHEPPVKHNSARLLQLSSFCDKVNLEIRDRSYALDIGGGLASFGVKVEASLTERERIHHNPMRDGEYKDLRITVSGSFGKALPLDGLLADLLPALQAQGLGAADLESMTAGLGPELSAGTTLLLRFYKPRYQTLKEFPAEAAAYRLQFFRVSQSLDLAMALSGSVPVQPGVSAELGLTLGESFSTVLLERWGSKTLSGPMMHYFHLRQVEELDERWKTLCTAQHEPLQKLFSQLADPDSPVHAEAAYFLRQQEQEGELTLTNQFFSAMTQFKQADVHSFNVAKDVLDTFLERQYPLWQLQKGSSAAIQEQQLQY